MHKSTPAMEAGEIPSSDLIARVGGMIQKMAQAGAFLDGAGLRQSALGARLDFTAGQRIVTRGPFTGANELTAALCIVTVKDIDSAVGWATRLASLLGDCRIDIRPVTEPWDLGMAPRPADLTTTRYMLLLKADAAFEAGTTVSAVRTAVAKLAQEMKSAGIYQTAEVPQPGQFSKRVVFKSGKAKVTDGPFAESKELIAGYVLLGLPSITEAIEWAPTYAAALGDIELDVRPLYEPSELA